MPGNPNKRLKAHWSPAPILGSSVKKAMVEFDQRLKDKKSEYEVARSTQDPQVLYQRAQYALQQKAKRLILQRFQIVPQPDIVFHSVRELSESRQMNQNIEHPTLNSCFWEMPLLAHRTKHIPYHRLTEFKRWALNFNVSMSQIAEWDHRNVLSEKITGWKRTEKANKEMVVAYLIKFAESTFYFTDYEEQELYEMTLWSVDNLKTWFHEWRKENGIEFRERPLIVFTRKNVADLEKFFNTCQFTKRSEVNEEAVQKIGLRWVDIHHWILYKRRHLFKRCSLGMNPAMPETFNIMEAVYQKQKHPGQAIKWEMAKRNVDRSVVKDFFKERRESDKTFWQSQQQHMNQLVQHEIEKPLSDTVDLMAHYGNCYYPHGKLSSQVVHAFESMNADGNFNMDYSGKHILTEPKLIEQAYQAVVKKPYDPLEDNYHPDHFKINGLRYQRVSVEDPAQSETKNIDDILNNDDLIGTMSIGFTCRNHLAITQAKIIPHDMPDTYLPFDHSLDFKTWTRKQVLQFFIQFLPPTVFKAFEKKSLVGRDLEMFDRFNYKFFLKFRKEVPGLTWEQFLDVERQIQGIKICLEARRRFVWSERGVKELDETARARKGPEKDDNEDTVSVGRDNKEKQVCGSKTKKRQTDLDSSYLTSPKMIKLEEKPIEQLSDISINHS